MLRISYSAYWNMENFPTGNCYCHFTDCTALSILLVICGLLNHVPCRSYQLFPAFLRTSSDAALWNHNPGNTFFAGGIVRLVCSQRCQTGRRYGIGASAWSQDFDSVEVASVSKNINIFWLNGIKVDMVNYPYPWLDLPIEENRVRLASLNDIAAMKIAAIVNRGTKKDFIDLYTLLQSFSLDNILDMYSRKYSDGSLFIVMKSLIYFDDAETDPMPNVLNDTTWEDVKDCLRTVVRDSSLL